MDSQRDQCRQLLEQIPDEGLDDLETTLREMVEWYESLKRYMPPDTTLPSEVTIAIED